MFFPFQFHCFNLQRSSVLSCHADIFSTSHDQSWNQALSGFQSMSSTLWWWQSKRLLCGYGQFLGVLHLAKYLICSNSVGLAWSLRPTNTLPPSIRPEKVGGWKVSVLPSSGSGFSCFSFFSCQGPVVVSVDGEPWSTYESGVFDGCRRHPEMTEPRHSKTSQIFESPSHQLKKPKHKKQLGLNFFLPTLTQCWFWVWC